MHNILIKENDEKFIIKMIENKIEKQNEFFL